MKKYVNIAFIYMVLSLISGVVYRETTKIYTFTDKTTLSITHVHLMVLGAFMFLIIALFHLITDLSDQKLFKYFLILYNIALPLMVIMLYVRGIIQVLSINITSGLNHAISGISGLSHVLLSIALILLFLSLRKSVYSRR